MAYTPYDTAAQQQAINQMYDAQKQNQLSQLESAYTQQRSNYEAEAQQVPRIYQAQANDLAVQYERNRRNLNEQAAARGLNTGTASQQQLALNQMWQRNYGTLKGQQAQAEVEAQRRITDLENAYRQQVAQAISNNDYDRAKALYDEAQTAYQRQMQEDELEYNRAWNEDQRTYTREQNELALQREAEQQAYNQALTQAKLLAQYGDFSGYGNLYGSDAAGNMAAEYQRLLAQEQDATAYERNMTQAKLLASYGDFSGFANLYGQDVAAQMSALWTAQNPDLAYNTGRINAEQYRQITGSYPAGYEAPKTYNTNPNPNPNPTPTPTPEPEPETPAEPDLAALQRQYDMAHGGVVAGPGGSVRPVRLIMETK